MPIRLWAGSAVKEGKEIKGIRIGKHNRNSPYSRVMITYVRNHKKSLNNTRKQINEFTMFAEHKT